MWLTGLKAPTNLLNNLKVIPCGQPKTRPANPTDAFEQPVPTQTAREHAIMSKFACMWANALGPVAVAGLTRLQPTVPGKS